MKYDDEVCRLWNMFCKIKYIVFKIKILTVLLLCRPPSKIMEENASPPPSPFLEIFPDLPQPLVKRRAGGVEGGGVEVGGVCVCGGGGTLQVRSEPHELSKMFMMFQIL